MNTVNDFKPGDKVTYTGIPFNPIPGIVKSVNEVQVFVVVYCGGDWDNYQDYHAVECSVVFLRKGWEVPIKWIELP